MNAAEERSPGTTMLWASSSSVHVTRTVRPSRRTPTPAPASIRSVWSRLGTGSTTVVVPSAPRPANRTQDFTCALATGSS